MTRILGIVNVTRDSFSDGGRFLAPGAALQRARELVAAGADYVDLGAESTHPDSQDVPVAEEIRRLEPLLAALTAEGVRVSVDTHKPEVMRIALNAGAAMINDVNGLRHPEAIPVIAGADAKVVVMYSSGPGPRAARAECDPDTIVDIVEAFFEERLAALATAGVSRERIVLDPGLGMFLGRDPRCSVAVLRAIPRLRRFGVPLLISASRKSFVSALARPGQPPPAPLERDAATLATELFAAAQGAAYIRTHQVRALRDALGVWASLHPATT